MLITMRVISTILLHLVSHLMDLTTPFLGIKLSQKQVKMIAVQCLALANLSKQKLTVLYGTVS
jgi:hypothetical protein